MSTCSQAINRCIVMLDLDFFIWFSEETSQQYVETFIIMFTALKCVRKMNNICFKGDVPKDSVVAHIIKSGLFDFVNLIKYIPKHV